MSYFDGDSNGDFDEIPVEDPEEADLIALELELKEDSRPVHFNPEDYDYDFSDPWARESEPYPDAYDDEIYSDTNDNEEFLVTI